MPRISVNNITIIDERDKYTLSPVVASVLYSESGATGSRLINTRTELEVLYPELPDITKNSLEDLIDTGNPLFVSKILSGNEGTGGAEGRFSNLIFSSSDKDPRGYTASSIDADINEISFSLPKFTQEELDRINRGELVIRFAFSFDTFKSASMYYLTVPSGSRTVTIAKDGKVDTSQSLQNVVTITYTPYVHPDPEEDKKLTPSQRRDKEIQLLVEELAGIVPTASVISSGGDIYLYYPTLVVDSNQHSYSAGDTEFTIGAANNTLLNNSIITVVSRNIGKFYDGVRVKIELLGLGMVGIRLNLPDSEYSEYHIGDLVVGSIRYLPDIVDRDSLLVRIPKISTEEEIQKIVQHEDAHLGNGQNPEYRDRVDSCWSYTFNLMSSDDNYKIYAVVDLVDPTDLDIATSNYYRDILSLTRLNNYNCSLIASESPRSRGKYDSLLKWGEFILLMGGEVSRMSDNLNRVTPTTPLMRSIMIGEILGKVPYNIVNPETLSKNVNYYTRDWLNSIDEIVDYTGSPDILSIIWTMRISRTTANMIQDLVPDIDRSSIEDIVDIVGKKFQYIDSYKVVEYYESNGYITVVMNLRSNRLNIRNRKLNLVFNIL